MAVKLAHVPRPHGIHPDTLNSGRHVLQIQSEGKATVLACYCPRNFVGAVFYPHLGFWEMFTPIAFGDFLEVLGAGRVIVPDNPDANDWIEACGLTAAPTNSKRAH